MTVKALALFGRVMDKLFGQLISDIIVATRAHIRNRIIEQGGMFGRMRIVA